MTVRVDSYAIFGARAISIQDEVFAAMRMPQ